MSRHAQPFESRRARGPVSRFGSGAFWGAVALALGSLLVGLLVGCDPAPPRPSDPVEYDLILRGGTLYDGSGGVPLVGDLAIDGERIAAVGELGEAVGRREVDVTGLAVSPGFINVLSWASESLLLDGRAVSDLHQGITTEVMGEGWSMGPWNETYKEKVRKDFKKYDEVMRYEIAWSTLGEYLDHLAERGVSPNVASFVGATTLRLVVMGEEDREPTEAELEAMCTLVRAAMAEGALGVGSALIYNPGTYADTAELTALAAAAGESGGLYISHLRSESSRLVESIDELITIARDAGVRGRIYHLKSAGKANWHQLDEGIDRIEAARAAGVDIRADIYPYTAGATGLNAAMPPWVRKGGYEEWARKLKDPETRRRVIEAMRRPGEDWENLLAAAGSADKVVLVSFQNPELRSLTGKTLGEVARMRGVSPEDAAIDLVIEDGSRVGAVYFLMSEENVRRKLRLPWVSLGTDGWAPAPEAPFLDWNPHPRTYGSFPRLLGRYVRDEGVLTLEEAIHRITGLAAEGLGIRDRGWLRPGLAADVVAFDPAAIRDRATYEKPHQIAEGVVHVWVNGEAVVRDGRHTGAKPGQVVRGPGWTGWTDEETSQEP